MNLYIFKNTNKFFILISCIGVLLFHTSAKALDRKVSTDADNPTNLQEGSLRNILKYSCSTAGDDVITFEKTRQKEIRILLSKPLVIPKNCLGTITLKGSDQVDTLIDASNLHGVGRFFDDFCSLHVYSDNHQIENISFVGNRIGAAICLYGKSNLVTNSRIGIEKSGSSNPNRVGIAISNVFEERFSSMDGSGNELINNNIASNSNYGVYIKASGAIISKNTISSNGFCIPPTLPSQIFPCRTGTQAFGAGILVDTGSSNILIGGENFDADHNTIQFNGNGGIVLNKDTTINGIEISHNIISKNYGLSAPIDLGDDGLTTNDLNDLDVGPNDLLNFADHMQAFQVVGGFWLWGLSPYGTRTETYLVSPDDLNRDMTNGGNADFLGDSTVESGSFELDSAIIRNLSSVKFITSLTFDDDGNTSEFSPSLPIGPDKDDDGIPDQFETGNSLPDALSSNAENSDTDLDGLSDVLEDTNRNGICDINETCAYLADTDGDKLSDWAETHGDGIFNRGKDTDPFNPDTDNDGIKDGDEDLNKNGKWEAYSGETSPLFADSDRDGKFDAIDNCKVIPNPGQEPWYCQ